MNANFFNFIQAHTVLHEPGHCVQHVEIRPELLQLLGVVHGGIIAALIDDAIGEAMLALLEDPDELALTAQLTVTYLASCSDGLLTVDARIHNHGRTTGYGEAIVTNRLDDGDARIVARGNALLIRKHRRPENPARDQLQKAYKERLENSLSDEQTTG